jgi:hypothetical protein
MVDAVDAVGDVGIQPPVGLLVDEDIDGSQRLPRGASRSTAIAVRLKAGFPVGF